MVKKGNGDLGYLGEEFQFRLVHHFMDDKECFKDLAPIVDQNMFTNSNLRIFVGTMKDLYKQNDAVPSYETMRVALNSIAPNEAEREVLNAIIDKIMTTAVDSVDYIHDLALKFFRQQNIIRTANEILRIASNGDISKYETCVELLNKALHQGEHDDYGSSVFDDMGETLSDDYRIAIPTGISAIDSVLEGGLGKGELGVIIGPSSFGKTSLTSAIANFAATHTCQQNNNQGYKVLQIVFEDRVKQIQRKHIARVVTLQSGKTVEAKDLSKEEYKAIVQREIERYEKYQMLDENLRIVRFPSGEVTASKIRSFIKKLINNGFKPDLVIIDYFECVESGDRSSNSNEYENEGKTMRKFEAMASELDCAMWIPVQGTKDSVSQEIVTMDKAGGSFKKIQIAHIIMSIARTTSDIAENIATVSILKNRAGCSGKIFKRVYFNNGTCIINCDETNDDNGIDFIEYNKQKENTIKDAARMLALENEARHK